MDACLLVSEMIRKYAYLCKFIKLNLICLQHPLCTASQLACVHNITVNESLCIPPCSGLMITSYDKSEVDDDGMIFNDHFERDMKAYKKFKKWFQFSAATAGFKLFWLF